MTYWAHSHQCVSCQYWNGPRSIHSDPRVVEAPSGAKGTCMGNSRSYRGKEVSAGLHIGSAGHGGPLDCYRMWDALSE